MGLYSRPVPKLPRAVDGTLIPGRCYRIWRESAAWFTNQIAGLGHTYIFNPSLINEFRASFSRQSFSSHPDTFGYPDSVTGLSQVQKVLAPSKLWLPPYEPEPTFRVSGLTQFGTPDWTNGSSMAEAYTFLDNVTKIIGKHTLKTGFVYRIEHSARIINPPLRLSFDGRLTQDPTTTLGAPGMAQFLLGAVDNGSGLSYTAYPYYRWRYWGFYVQDDFRITSNFTLNFGVRYDINGLFKTRQGQGAMSNFCLSCPNELANGLPGKMVYWGDKEFPDNTDMAPANKDSIGPRVNFSWAPTKDRKTIIRGGFDIFYTNAANSFNNVGQGIAQGPQWQVFLDYPKSFYPNQCAPFTGNCVVFPLSDTTTDKSLLTQPPVPADRLPLAAHRTRPWAPRASSSTFRLLTIPCRLCGAWRSSASFHGTLWWMSVTWETTARTWLATRFATSTMYTPRTG